jgi:hypothetical protein
MHTHCYCNQSTGTVLSPRPWTLPSASATTGCRYVSSPSSLPSLPPTISSFHPSFPPSLPPGDSHQGGGAGGSLQVVVALAASSRPEPWERELGGREGGEEGGRDGGREGEVRIFRSNCGERYTSYPTSRLFLCLCAPAHPSSPHFWTTPTRTQTYPECDCLPRLPRASSQETAAQGKSPGQRQGQGQGQGEEGRKGGRRGRASKLRRLHLLCCAGRPLVVRSSICFSSY